jgi:drug/metabolite transporter (DMT)-like permease
MASLNPMKWSRSVKLVVAFATLYVVWGSTYLAIKIGLNSGLPPAAFAGMRLVPAGLILLGLARLRGVPLRMRKRDLVTVVTVGLFLLVGGMFTMFLAETAVPSGLAALLVAALPLWIALAESILPGMERPSSMGIAGLLVGLTGLGVLMYPRLTGMTGSSRQLLGIVVLMFGTWLWTTGSVLSKRRPVRADAMVATGYEMLAAGLVLCAIATVAGDWSRVELTPTGAGALAYLILFGSVIAFTAFVWALRNAPASKVMTYAFVNPVIAAFLGFVVLGERLDAWTLAGMVIIVAGVALTTTAPTRPPRAARPVLDQDD